MSSTMTTVNGVPVHGHRPIRPGLFMTVFCLGLFMTLLDITIVNIAIPDLVTDLRREPGDRAVGDLRLLAGLHRAAHHVRPAR